MDVNMLPYSGANCFDDLQLSKCIDLIELRISKAENGSETQI